MSSPHGDQHSLQTDTGGGHLATEQGLLKQTLLQNYEIFYDLQDLRKRHSQHPDHHASLAGDNQAIRRQGYGRLRAFLAQDVADRSSNL